MPHSIDRRLFGSLAAGALFGAGCSKAKPKKPDESPAPGTSGAGTDPKGASNVKVISPRARFKCQFATNALGKAEVHDLFLSADGSRLAISNQDNQNGVIQIWDVRAQPARVIEYKGRAEGFSPDGKMVVNGQVLLAGPQVLNADSGKVIWEMKHGGTYFCFRSPEILVVLDRYGVDKSGKLVIHQYDAATGKDAGSFEAKSDMNFDSCPPVKQGRELFLGQSQSNLVRVWDLQERKLLREFHPANPKPPDPKWGKSLWSGFLASPDGKWLLFQSGGDPVVYDTATGKPHIVLPKGFSAFPQAFLPGRSVYVSYQYGAAPDKSDKQFELSAFDLEKKTSIACFRGHESFASELAVSSDGKVMASVEKNGTVLLWRLADLG